MIFLIHTLEIALLLSTVWLGYRVIKAYNAEYKTALEQCDETLRQRDIELGPLAATISAKAAVESYIDDFFFAEVMDNNPLSALNEAQQVAIDQKRIDGGSGYGSTHNQWAC